MKLRKKLIEVALPLEAINKASAREKSIRHGHPSTLHLWWARRPLAAARAVIFSQMVDDPSEYVDTLKSDPRLRKKAERLLKERHEIWVTATDVKRKADEAKVDSPEPGPEPTLDEIIAEQERDRLFKIIEDLVLWENTTNERVLDAARTEIWQSWRRTCADNADHPRAAVLFDRNKLPAFHDPFAGGGALPLEAQRLGLEAYASDLNPVAVLINKAMIEIPPKFAGMPPVNPEWQSKSEAEKAIHGKWKAAEGLAEDVRYYGKWMRDEAEKRIGYLYPKAEVTEEMAKDRPDLRQYVGKELTVIAWLWTRTVKSPNPAFRDVDVPLASTFMLSTKAEKEVYVEPVMENGDYRFTVKVGKPSDVEVVKSGTKLARGANFKCIMSGSPMDGKHIYGQARGEGLGARLMAVVAESEKGRVYLPATLEIERVAKVPMPDWSPATAVSENTRAFSPPLYGMKAFGDLFTSRQLNTLVVLTQLLQETIELLDRDAQITHEQADLAKSEGQVCRIEYRRGVAVYLSFVISKLANVGSTLTSWMSDRGAFRETFARQALPMVWDYAEANLFANAGGSFDTALDKVAKVIEALPATSEGHVFAADAAIQTITTGKIVSTDPPYYDNIPYADLSDYFYVWLRKTLRNEFSEILETLAVPKEAELVASRHRHGSKVKAESFFLKGMTAAMRQLSEQAHPALPVTIYYAFKQAEGEESDGLASTGWETFLAAVLSAGFAISGTWPMRTEGSGRIVAKGTNALASSIVLVCKTHDPELDTVSRREFVNTLKSELPDALRHLQRGNIAPVDLAQAAIGPGMAVYTRYKKVLDAEGKPLTVRDALALINQTLDEVLAEQEGDFDADTRFAVTWFDQYGFDEGEYGVALVLSQAKNTSVDEMADPRTSPILEAKAGKVRLLRPEELQEDWTPESDGRLTVWDMVHQLVRVLEKDGESAAAAIAAKLGAKAETARELCYRLYTLCERKKRAAEALSYNGLVQSWPEIMRLAQQEAATPTVEQGEMFTK